jgi:hypothetical protein
VSSKIRGLRHNSPSWEFSTGIAIDILFSRSVEVIVRLPLLRIMTFCVIGRTGLLAVVFLTSCSAFTSCLRSIVAFTICSPLKFRLGYHKLPLRQIISYR